MPVRGSSRKMLPFSRKNESLLRLCEPSIPAPSPKKLASLAMGAQSTGQNGTKKTRWGTSGLPGCFTTDRIVRTRKLQRMWQHGNRRATSCATRDVKIYGCRLLSRPKDDLFQEES